MAFKINGADVNAIFSIETLVIYEEAFERDLLQDVLGRVKVDTKEELEAAEDAANGIYTVDYTTTNWTAITRALWAAIKVANPATPNYEMWAKEADFNISAAADFVVPEVINKFFRSEEKGDEEE